MKSRRRAAIEVAERELIKVLRLHNDPGKIQFAHAKLIYGKPNVRRIAASLGLPERSVPKLEAALKSIGRPGDCFSLELGRKRQKTTRDAVAVVRVWLRLSLVILARIDSTDDVDSQMRSPFDHEFLRGMSFVTQQLLPRWLRPPEQDGQVPGWVERISGGTVTVNYYDKDGQFIIERIPRDRFGKLTNLRVGAEFLFQVWTQGTKARFDILPLPKQAPSADFGARRTIDAHLKASLQDETTPDTGLPKEPKWTSERDKARYLREVREEFGLRANLRNAAGIRGGNGG